MAASPAHDESPPEDSVRGAFYHDGTEWDVCWQHFLPRVAQLGRLLFAAPLGSRLYNLQVPSSDVDLLAIVCRPTDAVVSFAGVPRCLKNENHRKPDFTVMELRYYLQLLLEGDSRMLEGLFAEPAMVVAAAPEWHVVRARRRELLTSVVVEKYLTEILGENGWKKIHLFWRTGVAAEVLFKLWGVVLRLLATAVSVVRCRTMLVWYTGASQHFFQDVRHQRYCHEELCAVLCSQLMYLGAPGPQPPPEATTPVPLPPCFADAGLAVAADGAPPGPAAGWGLPDRVPPDVLREFDELLLQERAAALTPVEGQTPAADPAPLPDAAPPAGQSHGEPHPMAPYLPPGAVPLYFATTAPTPADPFALHQPDLAISALGVFLLPANLLFAVADADHTVKGNLPLPPVGASDPHPGPPTPGADATPKAIPFVLYDAFTFLRHAARGHPRCMAFLLPHGGSVLFEAPTWARLRQSVAAIPPSPRLVRSCQGLLKDALKPLRRHALDACELRLVGGVLLHASPSGLADGIETVLWNDYNSVRGLLQASHEWPAAPDRADALRAVLEQWWLARMRECVAAVGRPS